MAATGSVCSTRAVRTSAEMSLPIICATTGRPVVLRVIASTIFRSGVESAWTRKYSVQ